MPTTNAPNLERRTGEPSPADCLLDTDRAIICPHDHELVSRLQAKHAEYRQRLRQYTADPDERDAIELRWKRVILATLLLDGSADYNDLRGRFITAHGNNYRVGYFVCAWEVIADYAHTGGTNNCGGTGLPQLPSAPPQTSTLPSVE